LPKLGIYSISQSLGRFNLSINLISDTIDDSSLGIGNLIIPFRKRIGTMSTFWKGNYGIILYLTDELVALLADYTLGIVYVQGWILYLLIAVATFLASDIEPIAALLVTRTI